MDENRESPVQELMDIFIQERLLGLFPPERTEDFFEALFGGAEDGAYDIRLNALKTSEQRMDFVFELHQRNGKCLACNLTHGLPQVFTRHPVINVKGLAAQLAELAGWTDSTWTWELGNTEEVSDALHIIPLSLKRAG
jgi:hypothetical protein